jgi:epoxyqueuosine reductase
MAGAWNAELMEWVRAAALREGFDVAGVGAAPAAVDGDGKLTAERFTGWVEAGRAGEMEYLKRRNQAGELLRASARVAMPWARSVVVCAINYNGQGPRSVEPANADRGWIARYAWNGDENGGAVDYHDDLLRRLRVLEAGLRERVECETKCYVDTGPLLERDFAARAGVGWVGKNTCVIHQELGSWLLLGVIVTSLDVGADAVVALHPDRCGSCTRCIEACPTDALVAARQMDASRCISYLTIELKGSIPEPLRAGMGRQVFGCDICQDVCPWNRKAPVARKDGLRTREELVNPALVWLAELDDVGFKREFKGSPLERTKRRRVQRNVAIAMGNSGLGEFAGKLEEWAAGEDEVLAEAAAWALGRLAECED